ncbi:hypothetical protein QTP88_013128 [Uroleucon formosanum]
MEPKSFCSGLQEPGTIIPSLFSLSKTPGGVYNELEDLLFLKKLCNNTQVIAISCTFSGSRITGPLNMRKTDAIIPNTFSTTWRVRESRNTNEQLNQELEKSNYSSSSSTCSSVDLCSSSYESDDEIDKSVITNCETELEFIVKPQSLRTVPGPYDISQTIDEEPYQPNLKNFPKTTYGTMVLAGLRGPEVFNFVGMSNLSG